MITLDITQRREIIDKVLQDIYTAKSKGRVVDEALLDKFLKNEINNFASNEDIEVNDITKEDIASLEKKLQHNLDHALTHFSKHVKQLISDEIVKRYYGQKGEIIYNLRDDTDLEESFRILEDMERYKEILSPQKNAVTKTDSPSVKTDINRHRTVTDISR